MMRTTYDDFMKKYGIYPVKISSCVFGWHLKDVKKVLNCLKANRQIVLGGDILDLQKNYTYDSWFYNYNHSKCLLENVNSSMDVALDYVTNYIRNNGEEYYVVLVLY